MEDITIISIDRHRNGIGGDSFYVALFTDKGQPGQTFVGIIPDVYVQTSDEPAVPYNSDSGLLPCYVLEVGLLSQGDIKFGHNSWRGDRYFEQLREAFSSWSGNLYPETT